MNIFTKLSMKVLKTRFISNAFAPIVKTIVKEAVSYFFNSFLIRDKKNATVSLVSGYPIVDVPIEDSLDKTSNVYDDAIVDGCKEGMESAAKAHGIELQNLDSD